MGRLIDVEIAAQKIMELAKEPDYQHEDEDWRAGLFMAESVLEEVPTANIAEQLLNDICQIGGCSRGVFLNPWDITELKEKYGVK